MKLKQQEAEIARPGLHNTTILRVEDLGMLEGKFGTKEYLRIVFQTGQKDSQGHFLEIWMNYQKSLHPTSKLSKHIQKMGFVIDNGEFETDDLLGFKVAVVAEHRESYGKRYVNVADIIPPQISKVKQNRKVGENA